MEGRNAPRVRLVKSGVMFNGFVLAILASYDAVDSANDTDTDCDDCGFYGVVHGLSLFCCGEC
jgi:hypothetical protein